LNEISTTKVIVLNFHQNTLSPPLREIYAIKTGPRCKGSRSIKRIKTTEGFFPTDLNNVGKEARCELDTRADTICAGINCRPIYFTGQTCEAYGFHDNLSPITDVPIATVATAWSNPSTGDAYIIIMNEVLFFGQGMDHSLINPNQVRHYGLQVHDNPYDQEDVRSMGIMLTEAVKLPFRSDGSTIYFSSWFPHG